MKTTKDRVRLSASDVANFLACQHLTRLDLLRALGQLRPPREFDIGFEDLVRRGEKHEREVLERFRTEGHEVVNIGESAAAVDATLEAIRPASGSFTRGRW